MKKLYLYFSLSVIAFFVIINFGAEYMLATFFEKDIIAYNEQVAVAPLTMVSENIQKMSEEDRAEYIKKASSRFKYPIKIEKLLSFGKEEHAILVTGKLISNLDGDIYKKLIDGTEDVLVIGPFPSYLNNILTYIVYGIIFLSMILFSLLQVLFIWSGLKKLNDAAKVFGNGDFTAKIKVSNISYIKSIAKTFNEMGERIENLISSHKDLTNAVAHELRTPLARMKFELEKLKDFGVDDKTLAGINTDLNDLDSLISELLTYSRLDRQEDFLNKEVVLFSGWVEEYLTEIRPIENKKFYWNIHESCDDISLEFDVKLLKMAVNNLIMNGFKYCNTSVNVNILCQKSHTIIQVQDDGNGIEKSQLEDIFKPFQRLPLAESKEVGGFGLGLAVVDKIIKLHDGTICAENIQDSGMLFTITLNRN